MGYFVLCNTEQGGIRDEDKRKYDLLKFSVERMTQSLMELGQ